MGAIQFIPLRKESDFMEKLFLIKPNVDFEKEYSEMIADWKANDENHMPWFLNFDPTDFKAMVEKLEGLE